MRLSWTLSRYIGWQFFLAFIIAFGGLVTLVALVDFVEILRRASEREHVPFGIAIEMALLRIPYQGARLLPFGMLIGGMMALARLTRSSELIVARAAGVSVWQFLAPALALALFIGIASVTVFNPISAAML